MSMFTVQVHGAAFACRADQAVLAAMEWVGVAAIAVGCRGGGCGACKVKVLTGNYRCGRMSRAHVTEQEQAEGYALSCRLYPLSDLTLTAVRQPFKV